MSNLNLKGVWIPIEILIDDNLSDKEKLIYSIILFLSKENNYCYCNNSSLSELLNISTTQVSNGVRIDIWTHLTRECIINYVH